MSLFVGCGFQSSKPLYLNEDFQPIQFSARDPLEVTLKRELLKSGVSLFDTSFKKNKSSIISSPAKSQIILSNISRQQRNYSVSLDGKNAEYQLILSTNVLWKTAGDTINHRSSHTINEKPKDISIEKILLQERLSVETIIYGNPTNPSAERSEIRQARELLRKKLSRDIIALIRNHSLHPQ